MFVRSLKLSGFKSFADPTILDFDRGVNVIVGPNGSGKSNIADALQWVLGSQAPSTLRGGSMEDVIFAGSPERPRLGMARIDLTLDNTNRALPLDLNEVTISRSTDRSGQSEYEINGAACRLLDITELLSDTGIGRSIHTIVGQGQLDSILQARPEDRRHFIEEAAQIGKYRRRKDRSLRKIERVDENFVRLNDVLTELRRAIRPLKRQATAAAAYSELMVRHRDLKQRLASTDLNRLKREGASVDPDAEARRAELLGDELASVRARLASMDQERHALAETAQSTLQAYYGMGRMADRFASLSRLARERAAGIGVRLSAETEEGYRERIRLLEHDKLRWSTQAVELETIDEEAAARVRRAGEVADREQRDVEAAESALAEARSRETAAAQSLVRAEGAEAAGRASRASVDARVRSLIEKRQVVEHAVTSDASSLEAAAGEVKSLEIELDAATEAAAGAETRLEDARERADSLKIGLGASHAMVAAAEARLETLKEITDLFHDRPEVGERLAPLIATAKERHATASATEEDASRAVADVEAQMEAIWQEVARHDEELRRLDALSSGAAERVTGARRRLESREIEFAALSDELARAEEARAEAERDAIEERAILPARRAELEDMQRIREAADIALTDARARQKESITVRNAAELEARTANERLLSARLRVEEADAGIADAQTALAGLAELRISLQQDQRRAQAVARIAADIAQRAEGWATECQTKADRAREEARVAEERLDSFRARERELSEQLEEVGRRRSEAEIRRAETRARVDALAERAMEEWGLTTDEVAALETFNAEDEAAARAEVEKLDREMRRLGAVNPHAAEEYAELAEREKFLQEQIEDLKTSRRDLLKVVHEIDSTIVDVFRGSFHAVAREFEAVFDRLFPGGTGQLKLVDPDDLLTTGIEIEARPPGKNVRKMSLLSGGERSLVALAFLFAIFRSRPSPFYLLDEVEAALDDVNLQRFLRLIEELEEHAQVLIVTHQKRTMEAADTLYGVTMAKDGVSQVVAKRMEDVPA
jgi:chromosome segregation protein